MLQKGYESLSNSAENPATHVCSGIREFSFLVRLESSLKRMKESQTNSYMRSQIITYFEATLSIRQNISQAQSAGTRTRTSGCLSKPAACCPTLALSFFAFTTSSRSSASSMPVAEYTSGASAPSAPLESRRCTAGADANPPPAASAPGPAGLASLVPPATFFFVPAFGAAFAFGGAAAASSASSRSRSALRSSSSRRFSAFSSLALDDLAPSAHSAASAFS